MAACRQKRRMAKSGRSAAEVRAGGGGQRESGGGGGRREHGGSDTENGGEWEACITPDDMARLSAIQSAQKLGYGSEGASSRRSRSFARGPQLKERFRTWLAMNWLAVRQSEAPPLTWRCEVAMEGAGGGGEQHEHVSGRGT